MARWIAILAMLVACVDPLPAREGAEDGAMRGMVAEERLVADGVVDRSTVLPVGEGPYEQIGLHRLVVEGTDAGPGVLLMHGGHGTFRQAFASGEHALGVFLARQGYDVWGIDRREAFVPLEEDDFAFMEDWGMEAHVADLRAALRVARLVRATTVSDPEPLPVVAFSRGTAVAYATAAEEATLPIGRRHLAGLVAMDMALSTDYPMLRDRACEEYQDLADQAAQGVYHTGGPGDGLAALALADPTGQFPLIPADVLPVTNWTAAHTIRAAPWICDLLADAGLPLECGVFPTRWYHLDAGRFEARWVPALQRFVPVATGFTFADGAFVFRRALERTPYQAVKTNQDIRAMQCGDPAVADVSWDDAFSDVEVPLLYVGAMGGFGAVGLDTAQAFTSAEVSTLLVDPDPGPCPWPDPRACAFGHADLLYADNAPEVAWTPVLDWLDAHRPAHRRAW